jgi:hypothetical protein
MTKCGGGGREIGSGFAWMKRDFHAALPRTMITQPHINIFTFLFLNAIVFFSKLVRIIIPN